MGPPSAYSISKSSPTYVLEYQSEPIIDKKIKETIPLSSKLPSNITQDSLDGNRSSHAPTPFLPFRNEPASLRPICAQLPPRLPPAERLRPGGYLPPCRVSLEAGPGEALRARLLLSFAGTIHLLSGRWQWVGSLQVCSVSWLWKSQFRKAHSLLSQGGNCPLKARRRERGHRCQLRCHKVRGPVHLCTCIRSTCFLLNSWENVCPDSRLNWKSLLTHLWSLCHWDSRLAFDDFLSPLGDSMARFWWQVIENRDLRTLKKAMTWSIVSSVFFFSDVGNLTHWSFLAWSQGLVQYTSLQQIRGLGWVQSFEACVPEGCTAQRPLE